MAEVFAGFVCGYVLALISTPLLAVLLLRMRADSETLARLLPPGVSAMGLGVLLHMALFFFWTAIGILLGLTLLAMGDAADALGSLNLAFSLFVVAVVVAITAPVVIVVAPIRRVALAGAIAAVLVFGWLMPYMAEWSAFDGEDEVELVPHIARVVGVATVE